MVAALKLVGGETGETSTSSRPGSAERRGLFAGRGMNRSDPLPPAMRSRRPSLKGSERRIFPRKDVGGRVMGRRLDHSVTAHREPAVHLSMQDLSVGGLRADAQGPLERGEQVVVFFPPEGALRGWDAYGRVVRCLQKPDGKWEIALEFDPLPAA